VPVPGFPGSSPSGRAMVRVSSRHPDAPGHPYVPFAKAAAASASALAASSSKAGSELPEPVARVARVGARLRSQRQPQCDPMLASGRYAAHTEADGAGPYPRAQEKHSRSGSRREAARKIVSKVLQPRYLPLDMFLLRETGHARASCGDKRGDSYDGDRLGPADETRRGPAGRPLARRTTPGDRSR